MNMLKILCLGNEFIVEDSLAKEVGKILERRGFEIVNIKDSFEILSHASEINKGNFVILDVVENLESVKILGVDDLKESKIVSAHDFDAGFFLQLLKPKIKIVGIPQRGDAEKIFEEVQSHLTFKK